MHGTRAEWTNARRLEVAKFSSRKHIFELYNRSKEHRLSIGVMDEKFFEALISWLSVMVVVDVRGVIVCNCFVSDLRMFFKKVLNPKGGNGKVSNTRST